MDVVPVKDAMGGRRGASPKTAVILQPGYLPWLGFFEQLHRADVFVYYDDVPFDKHGWRNRNRVKAPTGQPHWLTVPVRHHGRNQPAILDVEIDNRTPWARKHIGTLRQFYARAPYCRRFLPELEEILHQRWQRLVDLNFAVVDWICRRLGMETHCLRSSSLGISGGRIDRLVAICEHLGADQYYSGAAAQAYLDVAPFAGHGIEVIWQEYQHPTYPQVHGPFVPHLSIIDLLFNCGESSLAILTHSNRQVPTPRPEVRCCAG